MKTETVKIQKDVYQHIKTGLYIQRHNYSASGMSPEYTSWTVYDNEDDNCFPESFDYKKEAIDYCNEQN